MSPERLLQLKRTCEGSKAVNDRMGFPFNHASIDLVSELIAEVERLETALTLVLQQDRVKGYPTGMEWSQLVGCIRRVTSDQDKR